jgi:Lysozyme inhibitor LprI
MKFVLAIAMAAASLSAYAVTFNPVQVLSQQSGLSPSDVTALIKDCSANQTSMNMCAWYDKIKVDHELSMILAKKRSACPHCIEYSKASIAKWQAQRDRVCKETAMKQWGDGSMEPAAESMCVTASTEQKIDSIRKSKCLSKSHA